MKMVGNYDWDGLREVSAFKLDTFEVAINMIRREWLSSMEQFAFSIYGEKSAMNRKIEESLPMEFHLERIRKLRFWYEEFLAAYEELKNIQAKKKAEGEADS
jgi:hypothetical protein